MRDRLFVMSTSVATEPQETVPVDAAKLIESLLLVVQNLTKRVESIENLQSDCDERVMIEVEPTRYGRAVICGTIYEIEEDEDGAKIKVQPSDGFACLEYTSETVAGAVASMLDDLGNDGMDYLLGLSLAAEDLVGQDEA